MSSELIFQTVLTLILPARRGAYNAHFAFFRGISYQKYYKTQITWCPNVSTIIWLKKIE